MRRLRSRSCPETRTRTCIGTLWIRQVAHTLVVVLHPPHIFGSRTNVSRECYAQPKQNPSSGAWSGLVRREKRSAYRVHTKLMTSSSQKWLLPVARLLRPCLGNCAQPDCPQTPDSHTVNVSQSPSPRSTKTTHLRNQAPHIHHKYLATLLFSHYHHDVLLFGPLPSRQSTFRAHPLPSDTSRATHRKARLRSLPPMHPSSSIYLGTPSACVDENSRNYMLAAVLCALRSQLKDKER
jgi:hypothetical protein